MILQYNISQLENKFQDFSAAQDKLADVHADQGAEIQWIKTKLADIKDRSCRNNIKFRDIAE